MKKYCVKCGKQFEATGREVICPSCKAQAAEDAKRAAVLKAKRASWNGESVPVRISGRASTLIRAYGAEKGLPFAAALDSLLQSTACFKGMNMAWEDIAPYRSHRRDKQEAPQAADKHATETAQDAQEQAAGKPQEVKQAAQAAKVNKTSTAKKTVKTVKTAGKAGKKA